MQHVRGRSRVKMKKFVKVGNVLLTVVLTVLSVAWIYPVFMILINTFKQEDAISTDTVFDLPAPVIASIAK